MSKAPDIRARYYCAPVTRPAPNPADAAECMDNCPHSYDPVCVVSQGLNVVNMCFAACVGHDPDAVVEGCLIPLALHEGRRETSSEGGRGGSKTQHVGLTAHTQRTNGNAALSLCVCVTSDCKV